MRCLVTGERLDFPPCSGWYGARPLLGGSNAVSEALVAYRDFHELASGRVECNGPLLEDPCNHSAKPKKPLLRTSYPKQSLT